MSSLLFWSFILLCSSFWEHTTSMEDLSVGYSTLTGTAEALTQMRVLYIEYTVKIKAMGNDDELLFDNLPIENSKLYEWKLDKTLLYIKQYWARDGLVGKRLIDLMDTERQKLKESEKKNLATEAGRKQNNTLNLTAEVISANGIQKASQFIDILRPLKVNTNALEKLRDHIDNEAKETQKYALELIYSLLVGMRRIVNNLEDVEIVKLQFPLWFDKIGKTLSTRYSQLQAIIEKSAKDAAAIIKLKEVDNLNEHPKKEEAEKLCKNYKEITMWKSMVEAWRNVWKKMREIQKILTAKDMNITMITYDSEVGKILIDLLLIKKQRINPLFDIWRDWENAVDKCATNKEWEMNVENLNIKCTLENVPDVLKYPVAQLQLLYDIICDKMYGQYLYRKYSEKNVIDDVQNAIPEKNTELLKNLLKLSLIPSSSVSINRRNSIADIKSLKKSVPVASNQLTTLKRSNSENEMENLRKIGKEFKFEKLKKIPIIIDDGKIRTGVSNDNKSSTFHTIISSNRANNNKSKETNPHGSRSSNISSRDGRNQEQSHSTEDNGFNHMNKNVRSEQSQRPYRNRHERTGEKSRSRSRGRGDERQEPRRSLSRNSRHDKSDNRFERQTRSRSRARQADERRPPVRRSRSRGRDDFKTGRQTQNTDDEIRRSSSRHRNEKRSSSRNRDGKGVSHRGKDVIKKDDRVDMGSRRENRRSKSRGRDRHDRDTGRYGRGHAGRDREEGRKERKSNRH